MLGLAPTWGGGALGKLLGTLGTLGKLLDYWVGWIGWVRWLRNRDAHLHLPMLLHGQGTASGGAAVRRRGGEAARRGEAAGDLDMVDTGDVDGHNTC